MTALYLRPPVRSQPQIDFYDEAQTCPHPELSGGKVPKLAGGRNLPRQSLSGAGRRRSQRRRNAVLRGL
jgi:hypothetical protein